MGMAFSFPVVGYDAMIGGLEALHSLGDSVRSILCPISYNGGDSKPAASAHGKLLIQGSMSLSGGEMEYSSLEPDKSKEPHDSKSRRFSTHLKKRSLESILIQPDFPQDEAAVKLQKVYKSFLVQQHWWKLLDFALLRRSSVSFFDIEKQESAVSRWSRAKSRAAKVGKGLSKDDKAQKLDLQHWLEAIDPPHRYGHNLQFYYDRWLQCESMQPFFYWLDVGEGKEVNLEQQCARSKLQQQCIKYLGPQERKAYELIIEEGKFMYRQSREVLDTRDGPKGAKWIFVLSTLKKLYVGQKKKGTFQHSSFLAGGATSAAGQLEVENGVLTAVWPHSGHYRPTQKNFEEFMSFLQDNNVDTTDVKKNPTEDDCSRLRNRTDPSHAKPSKPDAFGLLNTSPSRADPDLGAEEKLEESLNIEESEQVVDESKASATDPNRISSDEENETLSNSSHTNKLYITSGEENAIPSDMILRRINSKRKIQSYQLGRKLSGRWTTGAGPRIGCVRDYPSELRFRALEQVNLSPTSLRMSRFDSPRLANKVTLSYNRYMQHLLRDRSQKK